MSSFPGADLGGFVAVDTGSCACEWIDAGVKNGGKSELMTGFVFAYCSANTDTLSGGSGGTGEIFFQEGYQKSVSGSGTETGRFLLTGLPANTNCSSFFGGFRCYFLGVTFGNSPICMADGNVGWGWKFVDLGTDGVLGKSWIFTQCVQSCTGPGPDGLGMTDCVDQYCPPGFLLSTFSFGTTPFGAYFTAISQDFREAVPSNFPTTFTNASGINPVTLTDGASNDGLSPGLGDTAKTFSFAMSCTAADPSCSSAKVEVRAFNNPNIIQCLEVICQKPRFIKFGGPATGFGLAIVLPKDLSFACIPYCVQGYCFGCNTGCTGASLLLSNAMVETVDV
jgi:hypothetical protein